MSQQLKPPLHREALHREALRDIGQAVLRGSQILVLASLSFWVAALPALAQNSEQAGWSFQTAIQAVLTQIQQLGAVGVVAFVLLYILATVAFIPGSLLTLGAGVVYGVAQGSIYVLIGASLGAVLAFLIGRYFARGWVAQKIEPNPKFKAIDRAVGREGLKIVLLTRLSPVFPFNLLNYAFGITDVSLRDYALGCVGMLPGTVLYVYIGSLAGSLASLGTTTQPDHRLLQWTIRAVGFAATVAVTLYVTRIARRALDASVLDSQQTQTELPQNLPGDT